MKKITLVLGFVLIAIAIAVGVLRYRVKDTFRVSSMSMGPSLISGDVVRVDRDAYERHIALRGDLVVYHAPLENAPVLVGRIVGVAGDRLTFPLRRLAVNGVLMGKSEKPETINLDSEKDLRVYVVHEQVDGQEYDVWYSREQTSLIGPEIIDVTKDYVAIFGDHRDNSYDSRTFGLVPLNNIVGRVTEVVESNDRRRVGLTFK